MREDGTPGCDTRQAGNKHEQKPSITDGSVRQRFKTGSERTCGLETFHISGCAEVKTPQVEEKQKQGNDGDEHGGDDRGCHHHDADILQK